MAKSYSPFRITIWEWAAGSTNLSWFFLLNPESVRAVPAAAAAAITALQMVTLGINQDSVRIKVVIPRFKSLVVQEPFFPLIHWPASFFLYFQNPYLAGNVLILKS